MATLAVDDGSIWYEDRGSGQPIVLLHGAWSNADAWDAQVDEFAGKYRVVRTDVRGHGRTGPTDRRRYSIELFADDLDALLTALDLDSPVLCGLSMGGCIAQAYAAGHPDRIVGLVLADTFGSAVLDWKQRLQFLMLKATIPPVRLVGYQRVEKVMVWLQERIQGDGVSGDYEKIEQLRENAPEMTTDEFVKVIHALTRFHETALDLSVVTVPALVLYGEHDAGFIRRYAPKLGADIPDATVREVPGGGHASNLDSPEFFTSALREYLSRLPGPGVPDRSDVDGDV